MFDPQDIYDRANIATLASQDPVLKKIFSAIDRVSKSHKIHANGQYRRVKAYAKVNLAIISHSQKIRSGVYSYEEMCAQLDSMTIEHEKASNNDVHSYVAKQCLKLLTEIRDNKNGIGAAVRKLFLCMMAEKKRPQPENPSSIHLNDFSNIIYAIYSDAFYYRPYKFIMPNTAQGFRVQVITFVTLHGGRPGRCDILDVPIDAPYFVFVDMLTESILKANKQCPARLGGLDIATAENGKWFWQPASSMRTLNDQAWQSLEPGRYDEMMAQSKVMPVFVMHEFHHALPAAIEDKIAQRPERWNTWMQQQSTTGPLPLGVPPEFQTDWYLGVDSASGSPMRLCFRPSTAEARSDTP